jgi:hypothetical protein
VGDGFDPYKTWLGIPATKRPLTAYTLLGLAPLESDAEKIQQSAGKRRAAVEKHLSGPAAKIAEKVLGQLNESEQLLLDPQRKAKYDAKLKASAPAQAAAPPQAAPPANAPPAPAAKAAARPVAAPVAPPAAPIAAPIGQPMPTAQPAASGQPFQLFTPPEDPKANKKTTGYRKKSPIGLYATLGVLGLAMVGGIYYLATMSAATTTASSETVAENSNPTAPAAPVALGDPNAAAPLDTTALEPQAQVATAEPVAADVAPLSVAPTAVTVEDTEPTEIAWQVQADSTETPATVPTAEQFANLFPEFRTRSFAFDPTGKLIGLGGNEGQVAIWNTETGEKTLTGKLGSEPIESLAVLAADRVLVWGQRSGIVPMTGAEGTAGTAWAAPVARPESNTTAGLAISPGGKYVAVVRNGVRVYLADSGNLVGIAPIPADHTVVGHAFSPDGQTIVLMAQRIYGLLNHSVVRVEMADGSANWDRAVSSPGDLREKLNGPTLFRNVDFGSMQFLHVGTRYVVNVNTSELTLMLSRAPEVGVPLADGAIWDLSAETPKIGQLEWAKMLNLVESRTQGRGLMPIGRGTRVALQIATPEVALGKPAEMNAALKAGLEQYLATQGMPVTPSGDTLLAVTYRQTAGEPTDVLMTVDADGHLFERKLETPVAAPTGTLNVTFTARGLGNETLYEQEIPVPAEYLIAPHEVATSPPEVAMAAAGQQAAILAFSGYPLTNWYRKEFTGGKELPVRQVKLK